MVIAFDTSTKGSASATSITISHTTAVGSTLGVYLIDTESAADNMTTVTVAGSGMTRLIARNNGTDPTGESVYIYGILNPTSGAQNWVANSTASEGWIAFTHTYSGTRTDILPTVTASAASSTGGAVAPNLTAAANSWVVGICANDFANGISMDAGHPFRQFNGATAGGSSRGSFDTNAAVTGSDTTTFTPPGGSGNVVCAVVAIEPPGAAVTAASVISTLAFLGVG